MSTLLKVGQTSVGQTSVGQTSVAEKSRHRIYLFLEIRFLHQIFYGRDAVVAVDELVRQTPEFAPDSGCRVVASEAKEKLEKKQFEKREGFLTPDRKTHH
jgi:hypothetical protein